MTADAVLIVPEPGRDEDVATPNEALGILNRLARDGREAERGLRRHVARTGPAKLPEQNEETVLVVWRQIRPAPPGLHRQVTNLAALIGRESIPVLPTLRVQPQDRREDSAPRDFPHGGDRLQTPRWHRCRFWLPRAWNE